MTVSVKGKKKRSQSDFSREDGLCYLYFSFSGETVSKIHLDEYLSLRLTDKKFIQKKEQKYI